MNPNWLFLILPGCQAVGSIAVYMFKQHYGEYFGQKGKNRADKEDKAKLVQIEEFVKSGFSDQSERLKASFQTEIETLKSSFAKETEIVKAQLSLLNDKSGAVFLEQKMW